MKAYVDVAYTYILNLGTRSKVRGQIHVPTALTSGKYSPLPIQFETG